MIKTATCYYVYHHGDGLKVLQAIYPNIKQTYDRR